MSDFDRVIDKALAELAVAKALGPKYAAQALQQAKHHISQAIDAAQHQHMEEPCTPSSPATPK